METRVNDEECTIRLLYDAAVRGCVLTLNTLLQKDQFIIHKISLTSFTETPLHISALLGHIEFTEVLLTKNPSMASELDSLKRSPLHLASAEGHTEVVKALLRANNDVCTSPDQDDRIPLHLAAMRGRVEVIQELVRARPNSASVMLDGDSIFHLCVKFNHLEALKLFVNLVNDDREVVRGNKDGNTILHLAVMLNQAKTVQYLLSVPGVKEIANNLNEMNLTSLDTLDLCPCRDFKSLEIRNSLMEAGARRAKDLNTSLSTALVSPHRTKSRYAKCLDFLRYRGITIEDTGGSLMIVATVIATMSFQAAIDPPKDFNLEENCWYYEKSGEELAFLFFLFNTIAFISSLSVILLVISGFPVRNRFVMWLFTLSLSVAVSFNALSYLQIVRQKVCMLGQKSQYKKMAQDLSTKLYTWIGVQVGVIFLFLAIRSVVWTTMKLKKCCSWLRKSFSSSELKKACFNKKILQKFKPDQQQGTIP